MRPGRLTGNRYMHQDAIAGDFDQPGRNFAEYSFTPSEYFREEWGNKLIQCPPLINTSIRELHTMNWRLLVVARHVPAFGSTKIKWTFHQQEYNPGWPFLIFKAWVKGKICHPDKILDEFYTKDLTPNFSRPPSFSLKPVKIDTIIREVVVEKVKYIDEDEVGYLQRMNAERMAQRRLRNESSASDEISFSPERLVG